MVISAGALDRRITIISVTSTRDAAGQPLPTAETEVATVWAQRLEYRTTDVSAGPGTKALAIGRYRVRYRPDLTTAYRIRIDGTSYAITSISEPDSRVEQIITLEALS